MKAFILASRRSTRLLPLTKGIPQCLLKINDKTILEHQLDLLKLAGINDITVICGHMAKMIETFCKKLKVKTLLNPFYEVSGMALTLWLAKNQLKGSLLLLYSDILFDSNVLKGLLENKKDICLAIKKHKFRDEAEKVVEKDGIIKYIGKNDMAEWNSEFVGIAKFSNRGTRRLLEILDDIARVDLHASFIDLIAKIIKQGRTISSHDIEKSKYIDIDFPDDLKEAKRLKIN